MSKAGFGYEYQGGLGQRLQKRAEERAEEVRVAGGGLKARIDVAQGVTPRVAPRSAPLAARVLCGRDSFAA